ncbi:hypothetical protein ACU4GD_01780 [Cupriavidus basilensis]
MLSLLASPSWSWALYGWPAVSCLPGAGLSLAGLLARHCSREAGGQVRAGLGSVAGRGGSGLVRGRGLGAGRRLRRGLQRGALGGDGGQRIGCRRACRCGVVGRGGRGGGQGGGRQVLQAGLGAQGSRAGQSGRGSLRAVGCRRGRLGCLWRQQGGKRSGGGSGGGVRRHFLALLVFLVLAARRLGSYRVALRGLRGLGRTVVGGGAILAVCVGAGGGTVGAFIAAGALVAAGAVLAAGARQRIAEPLRLPHRRRRCCWRCARRPPCWRHC